MTVRVPIETRYTDYDTKSHVNNAVYLAYFEQARWKLWVEEMRENPDPPVIVAEARVRYLRPAMIGTPLAVEVFVTEIRTRSWTFGYRVLDPRDDTAFAEGTTALVYFEYATRQPAPIPDDLRRKLEGLLVAE